MGSTWQWKKKGGEGPSVSLSVGLRVGVNRFLSGRGAGLFAGPVGLLGWAEHISYFFFFQIVFPFLFLIFCFENQTTNQTNKTNQTFIKLFI